MVTVRGGPQRRAGRTEHQIRGDAVQKLVLPAHSEQIVAIAEIAGADSIRGIVLRRGGQRRAVREDRARAPVVELDYGARKNEDPQDVTVSATWFDSGGAISDGRRRSKLASSAVGWEAGCRAKKSIGIAKNIPFLCLTVGPSGPILKSYRAAIEIPEMPDPPPASPEKPS